ncbi:hypothetical protein BH10PSE9_BH10PSE9_08920 [soil metagenome]
MRVLAIENYAGTPLGQVERALEEAGAVVDLRRAWQGAPIPDRPGGYDALVVLGGEQSARSTTRTIRICRRSPR